MATLKDILNKISAVKKTRQITKAMNMVAASRLRGAQTGMDAFRPYAEKFSEVLEDPVMAEIMKAAGKQLVKRILDREM